MIHKAVLIQTILELKESGSHYVFSNYLRVQLKHFLIKELQNSDLVDYVQFRDYDYNIVPNSQELLDKLYAWISDAIVEKARDDEISAVGNIILEAFSSIKRKRTVSDLNKLPKAVLESIYNEYNRICESKAVLDRLKEHYKDILSEILENFRRETLCVYVLYSLNGIYPDGRIKEYQYYPIFNTFFDRKSDRTPEECKETEEREYKKRTEEYYYQQKEYANDNSQNFHRTFFKNIPRKSFTFLQNEFIIKS